MRVRMKIDQSGTRTGYWGEEYGTREWPPRGSVVDLPDSEAAHYCSVGMADPVAVFAEAEKAIMTGEEVRQGTSLRTDTDSGQAVRRGPGRPRKGTQPQEGEQQE